MVRISAAAVKESFDALPLTAVAPSLPADEKKLRKKKRGQGKGVQVAPGQLTQYESYEIIEVHRGEIKNAPYNPRTITAGALQKLKAKLLKIGLVAPITWNKRTGNIVGGHQRMRVLDTIMGIRDYRVRVAAVDMDEKTERETNVFLNNETAQGEWDYESLEKLFKQDKISVEEAGWDLGEYLNMFGDEGFAERPEELEDLADKIKAMADVDAKITASASDRDSPDFYSVVIFKDPDERAMFNAAWGLADDQYMDGRVLWRMMKSVGIRSDEEFDEQDLLDRHITQTIKECERCGCKHDMQTFRPLSKEIGEFNYYGICLTTGEPLLIYISPEELKQIQDEARAGEEDGDEE